MCEELKQFAMIDGGLTEFEADEAISNFNPVYEGDYCQDCGCELIDGKNCKDSIDDDYCTKCWNKSLRKQAKYLKS